MSIEIKIKENKFNLDINDLIVMGKRSNNEKRNFLFISKVLGKHLEIKPKVCREIGKDLVKLLDKNNSPLVLGFAETATGIGMAAASHIKDSYYVTTTREEIESVKSIFEFDEEHSHAVEHRCLLEDKGKLFNAKEIVLVDDEITTGKSMLNIISEIIKHTKVRNFKIITILDWRNKEYLDLYEKFIKENSVNIEVLSLIKGEIEIKSNEVYKDEDGEELKEKSEVIDLNIFERRIEKTKFGEESYLKNSGRFGVSYDEIIGLEDRAKFAARAINKLVGKGKILVLGHGENIYIPSRIGSYLEGDIYYKTTTRSPIYCEKTEGYPIQSKNIFFNKDVKYYFYNKEIVEKEYDKVVLITEDNLNIKLTENMIIVRL
ncbi:MAG: phosphoribosyltransferase domain-containing protein [Clostridium sp.]|uniref:phosphoribosyltransferase domain-containing protein n=1 Tax=Clostridium sp. TaxID=1506 RepID=UPI003F3F90D7